MQNNVCALGVRGGTPADQRWTVVNFSQPDLPDAGPTLRYFEPTQSAAPQVSVIVSKRYYMAHRKRC